MFDDNLNEGNYWNCFGKNGKKVKAYSKEDLDVLAAQISMWFRMEYIRKAKMKNFVKENPDKKDTIPHLAYQPRFHYFWSYNYIINKFYNEKWQAIIKSINNGSLFKDDNIIDKWFPIIHSQIAVTLNTKQDGLNFRNWQRTKKDSTDKLKTFFDLQLIDHYPLKIK